MLRFAFSAVLASSLTAAAALAQPQPSAPPPQVVYIHAGTLLAIPGQAPQNNMTVVVEGDRIARIEPGFAEPDSDTVRVIDLTDGFVMPGLMDAHVHLRYRSIRSLRNADQWRGKNYAESALNALRAARDNLAAGFTTVRDLGSDDQSVFAVRDDIAAGRVLGPRIIASGTTVSVTAGHGDPLVGNDTPWTPQWGVCDGPDDCRRATRAAIRAGADVIKMHATGGFSDNTGLAQHMDPDEMAAVIGTAHQRGLKVATHAYDPGAIRAALEAGVDSIEHGFLIDDEGIELMKDRGAYFVPTLSAAYPPKYIRPMIPDEDMTSLIIRDEARGFERVYAAGGRIAFGTDTGVNPHGDNWEEFPLMIKYGMSEMDALKSATVHTAELFGIADEAGTLEAGKLADIIAIDGNPLDDISAMQNVGFVMKSGAVFKHNGAIASPYGGL